MPSTEPRATIQPPARWVIMRRLPWNKKYMCVSLFWMVEADSASSKSSTLFNVPLPMMSTQTSMSSISEMASSRPCHPAAVVMSAMTGNARPPAAFISSTMAWAGLVDVDEATVGRPARFRHCAERAGRVSM